MKTDSTMYDSLFNTLFIVISVTVAPFLANLMQSPIYNYKLWACVSFVIPIMSTIIIWAIAVFRNSVSLRVMGWFTLVYEVARAPFVIATEVVGLESFSNTAFGNTPLSVSLELIASLVGGCLIMKRYHSVLKIKARFVEWLRIPVIVICALAIYEFLVGWILSG